MVCNELHFTDLYGVHVRPVPPFGSTSRKPHFDPALIHRCLPDELLFEVGAFFILCFVIVLKFVFLMYWRS